MKYLLYIDYVSADPRVMEYRNMEASNLLDAIEEADKAWDELDGSVYLMRIMEATSKIYKKEYGYGQKFKAVLCRRSFGWHLNTHKNSESYHIVERQTEKIRSFVAYTVEILDEE